MKMEPLLEELEAAAAKLGVRLSYESLSDSVGGGGLCKVNGTYRIIIDKRSTVSEKVGTLAKALASLDTGGIFLSPGARAIVERYQVMSGRQ